MSFKKKTIQSMLIPEVLTNNELLGMKSYLFHSHEFHLYSYAKRVKNLPEGVIVKDANAILPRKEIFRDTLVSKTAFADWFRTLVSALSINLFGSIPALRKYLHYSFME